ncbi:hypothetical protein ES703_99703 [subsurface metagenome]
MEVNVDISPSDGGTVEINGDAPCNYPTTVPFPSSADIVIEAVPASGYHFTGWSGEPTIDHDDNPVEVRLIRNIALTANFAPDFNEFTSADGLLNVAIPEGTTALDKEGNPLTDIEFTVANPPSSPQESIIVGTAYNLKPDGSTFDPPIFLTWSYAPADIPPGVAEEELVIAYYDEDANDWVVLESDIDPADITITAPVNHLTVFAILAPVVVVAPPPPPAMTFTTNSLAISPSEVNTGESVSISALVTNTAEEEGSGSVILKINGVIEKMEAVTLAGGASETVTFTTSRSEAGTYSVDINGLPGSFTVTGVTSPTAPPSPPQSTPSSSPSTPFSGVIHICRQRPHP